MSFDEIADIAISIVKPIEVEGIMVFLGLKVPWINIPIIRAITKNLIGQVVDYQMTTGRNAAFNIYIDNYKKAASEDAKKAVDELKGATTDEAKQKARDKIIDDMRRLGKFVKPQQLST